MANNPNTNNAKPAEEVILTTTHIIILSIVFILVGNAFH